MLMRHTCTQCKNKRLFYHWFYRYMYNRLFSCFNIIHCILCFRFPFRSFNPLTPLTPPDFIVRVSCFIVTVALVELGFHTGGGGGGDLGNSPQRPVSPPKKKSWQQYVNNVIITLKPNDSVSSICLQLLISNPSVG